MVTPSDFIAVELFCNCLHFESFCSPKKGFDHAHLAVVSTRVVVSTRLSTTSRTSTTSLRHTVNRLAAWPQSPLTGFESNPIVEYSSTENTSVNQFRFGQLAAPPLTQERGN